MSSTPSTTTTLGDLFERIYRGQTLVNIPSVPFRLFIHASITKIDKYACYGCLLLMEVLFHNKVTEIGRYAFAHCSNLQHINELPEGLLRVEDGAFWRCHSLRGEIVIPSSIQYMGGVFQDCSSLESVVFAPTTNVVQLGGQMFMHCSNLRFVTLPHNLPSIPAFFIHGCASLTHLHIPVSVREIGDMALCGSGLRSLTLSENVHHVGLQACGGCSSLQKVIIYSTHLQLATDIFVSCSALTVIMIAPWLWSTVFASMNEHPDFIFTFFRHYPTQIFHGGGGGG
mmetsp:Transcript_48296/g.53794  ORF Transcript_48296/g.53794 Transcript_48296/m.53794 type:complete len:284 (-) Transcript_48296:276-1127(-)